MRNNTKAREAILNFLQAHTDRQFTVEDIANEATLDGVKIPTATIYRTLVFFEQHKLVNKFVVPGENRSCYQSVLSSRDCNSHYHLKCNTCGKLIHLDCDVMASFTRHMENEHGFVVDLGRTLLYGVCVDCKKTEV
jgi:Fur family ferric uptake transcriptional regulator